MRPPIRLLLVDALNLIRRIYAAQDASEVSERLRTGRETTLRSLKRAIGQTQPTHALVVFDGLSETWRHRLFRDYKAGRRPMPPELSEALPSFREAFAEFGVRSFDQPDAEADDVIATLAVKVAKAGGEPTVLSTDKGYLQLLPSGVLVRDHFRELQVGAGLVRERFGVGPAQLADLFALKGDSTNSIPGVPGIGSKTATALLEAHGSLDSLLTAARRVSAESGTDPSTDASEPHSEPQLKRKLAEKLVEHAEAALLSRRLFELATDLELGLNLQQMRLPRP